MNETKYTPGPWQRNLAYEAKEKRPPYNVWTIIGNTNADERRHSVVATTITDDDDARLIAAAPELLEACKALLAQLEGPAGVWGDGRGNDGTKTGLSHQEFNALRDQRLNSARAAIGRAERGQE